MRLIVFSTGGAGYIGSHTVIELVQAGYDVMIADNFSNSSQKILPRLKKLCGKEIPYRRVDFTVNDQVMKLFGDFTFAGVIHFAALKSVGESVANPIMYYENNILSIINVLRAMQKYNCTNIVFSSSATVYREADRPLTEDMPLGASNPYGQTKFMAEQIIQDAVRAAPAGTLRGSLLRYFNPVGNHASGLIGEAPVGIPNNLLPYIQQVAIGRRAQLTVFGNDWATPDGTGVRDYIHVVDLAKGHVKAIDYLIKKQESNEGGCYVHNLGGGTGTSVLEMLKEFERACGHPIPYVIGPRRPGDLGCVIADPSKALREFGWRTELGIRDACESAWKWQEAHPRGFDDLPEDEEGQQKEV